jgi:hypothetical protein
MTPRVPPSGLDDIAAQAFGEGGPATVPALAPVLPVYSARRSPDHDAGDVAPVETVVGAPVVHRPLDPPAPTGLAAGRPAAGDLTEPVARRIVELVPHAIASPPPLVARGHGPVAPGVTPGHARAEKAPPGTPRERARLPTEEARPEIAARATATATATLSSARPEPARTVRATAPAIVDLRPRIDDRPLGALERTRPAEAVVDIRIDRIEIRGSAAPAARPAREASEPPDTLSRHLRGRALGKRS